MRALLRRRPCSFWDSFFVKTMPIGSGEKFMSAEKKLTAFIPTPLRAI